jgi:RNA polymerase sigma factor (sigma-70 family)
MNGNAADLDAALEAARAGQAWGYDALFGVLGAQVAGYLRGRGVHDPDDAANAVFLKAFQALHTFGGDGQRFRSWLFTIAHHASIDDRRRRGRRVSETALDAVTVEPAGSAEEVADEVMLRLSNERVDSLLARLSADQRDVLMLRVVADLTVEQTAASSGRAMRRSRRSSAGGSRRSNAGSSKTRQYRDDFGRR